MQRRVVALIDQLRRWRAERHFVPTKVWVTEVAPDVDCQELARWTQGYSGSDIHALCRDAAMAPLRRALDGKTPSEIKVTAQNPHSSHRRSLKLQ